MVFAERRSPLRLLLDEVACAARGGAALVIFDLDDTLLSTANRHLRILREFAESIAAGRPEAAAAVRGIRREGLRYSVADTAASAGLGEAMIRELKAFWSERFFTNPYLLEDDALPGGPSFVAELLRRGGRAVYMTGRDEAMREGTLGSLARHGFPAPDGEAARLVLKPKFDTPDLAFKTEAIARLRALGTVAGTFENEPAHVNLFAEHFPAARHFLLETRHSGKPVVPHPAAHRIPDFLK